MEISARWTSDCFGKQDFDGTILCISTRYWPRGGGFLIFDQSKRELGMQGNETRPEIKPSANAAIHLHHSVDGEDEYIELVEKDFEGGTEAEVKVQVEAWAKREFERIVAVLKPLYPATLIVEDNHGNKE